MPSYFERAVERSGQEPALRRQVEAVGLDPDRVLGHLRAEPYPGVAFAETDRATVSAFDLPYGFEHPEEYAALGAFLEAIEETRVVRVSSPVFTPEGEAIVHVSAFAAGAPWAEARTQWRPTDGGARAWCPVLSRHPELLASYYLVGDDPRWAAFVSDDDGLAVFATYATRATAAVRAAFSGRAA